MKVTIVGTGYVGLVAGACLAETGNDVVCVDVVAEKVDALQRGEIPIYEPGLEELVERNLDDGRLRFTTGLEEAVHASDIVFITVGTPRDEDGSADLRHVLAVARDVGRAMASEEGAGYGEGAASGEGQANREADRGKIVITKSTVPVGTAARVREAIRAETDRPVHVCSNPEFLKEGGAVDDFMKPDRVVLGVDSEYAADVLRELYAPFVRTGNQILLMDIPAAEITKYAANAMLATRISFMNSIARLCERVGADVNSVRHGVGSDDRIGPAFLFPGAGYGGSCFPKDVQALIRTFEELGEDASIFEAVEAVNARQKRFLLEAVIERFGGGADSGGADSGGAGHGDGAGGDARVLEGRTIAVWGLSFKPRTDDMREAPSLVTIPGLLERGARVVAHDPVALKEARRIFGSGAERGGGAGRLEFREKNYDVLEGADALVIHTEWLEYRRPDFRRMKALMKSPVVFDGRNLYDPGKMEGMGFEYRSVGRRPVGVSPPEGPQDGPGAGSGGVAGPGS